MDRLETDIITPPIPLSHPRLVKMAEDASGNLCYSAQVLIPKINQVFLTRLGVAMTNAAVNKFGEQYRDWKNKGVVHFISDGLDGDPIQDGMLKFSAKSFDKRPALLWKNLDAVVPDQIGEFFYPGAIVRILLSVYATDKGKSNTIAFGLNGIMYWDAGDRIGGSVDPKKAFAGIADTTFEPPLFGAPGGDSFATGDQGGKQDTDQGDLFAPPSMADDVPF